MFHQQMAQVIGRANQLRRMKLAPVSTTHDTRNTTIPCRTCRGGRVITIEHTDGIVRKHHCIACKGKGVIKN